MLNTYAQCPWMFFGRYVLGLREVIEPQRQLEAVDRGTFIHAVLFRMLRGLHNGEPLALAGLNDEELRAALDQAIAVEAAQVERRPLAAPALWQVQLAQMRQAIWDYLLAQRQLAIDPEASHFELAFGIDRDAPDSIDQASQSQSVEVDTPAGPIRIRGKIDRVDRVRYDGEAGLLLVDYKTGKPPSAAELADARHVQMPLYIHAARAMMPDMDCLGGVFHAVGSRHNDRYYGRLDYRRGSFRLDDDFDEKLDRATEQVGRYVAGMAAGRFDLLPTGKCPSWCEFGRICHFSPARHRVRTGTGAPGGDDCTSRGARR
jgi:RecB family exonuclease